MTGTPLAATSVVYAKDMARVAAFYQRTLGLAEREKEPGFIVLGSGAVEISIVRIPETIARSIDIATPPEPREDTPIKCSFLVDDLERVHAEAVAAGGGTRAIAEAWRWRGQLHLDGHDPEGNLVQFRQRGG